MTKKLDPDIKALRAMDRAIKTMSPLMIRASLTWAFGKYVKELPRPR